MKTDLLKKFATFYSKEFRDDLEALSKIEAASFEFLSNWLLGLSRFSQVRETDSLIELTRNASLTMDDAERILRPITWISLQCADSSTDIADLVEDLTEAKIIEAEPLAARVRSLCTSLKSLATTEAKELSPRLPLRYIKKIRTRCIFISEHERSFNIISDSPNTYKPILRAFHPAVTLELTFQDDQENPVGILLDSEELKTLRKWLQLAEIELQASIKSMPSDQVVQIKGVVE